MAEVTLILSDTADGHVAIRTNYKPALGAHCTPAQGLSMDMLRLGRREQAEIIDSPQMLDMLLMAAGQRDVMARLLTRCLDPLRNIEAEGGTEADGVAHLIGDAEAALQRLAACQAQMVHQEKGLDLEVAAA